MSDDIRAQAEALLTLEEKAAPKPWKIDTDGEVLFLCDAHGNEICLHGPDGDIINEKSRVAQSRGGRG